MDRTLVDAEIEKAARSENLISPFDPNGLKGASYDFRIGGDAIFPYPDGPRAYSLKIQGSIPLEPGHSCIVSSMEKVKLPLNMKGRLSIRSYQQLRGLFYSGGIIDPGYNGLLFFPLVNISDSPVDLQYKDPLVTCEFVALKDSARRPYKNGQEITEPQQRQKDPARISYTLVDISQKIDDFRGELGDQNTHIEEIERNVAVGQKLQELVTLGAVAGVVAAGASYVLSLVSDRDRPGLGVVVVLLIAMVAALLWKWRKK